MCHAKIFIVLSKMPKKRTHNSFRNEKLLRQLTCYLFINLCVYSQDICSYNQDFSSVHQVVKTQNVYIHILWAGFNMKVSDDVTFLHHSP